MTAVLDLLRTADGEVLAAGLVPGAGDTCVVLAHGFSGSSAKPDVRRIAAGLALGYARVVTCGWSMGGATVIRHGALRGTSPALVDRLGAHLSVLLERA